MEEGDSLSRHLRRVVVGELPHLPPISRCPLILYFPLVTSHNQAVPFSLFYFDSLACLLFS